MGTSKGFNQPLKHKNGDRVLSNRDLKGDSGKNIKANTEGIIIESIEDPSRKMYAVRFNGIVAFCLESVLQKKQRR